MVNEVISLFNEGKLLVRAMDTASLTKYDGDWRLDFTSWANEYEFSKIGLYSLSTTLILPEQKIPTYKSIGFLINSNKSDIRHVSRSDSLSHGNEMDGDFYASYSELKTLDDLIIDIKKNNSHIMNEVNINMKNDAYVGLFYMKCPSNRVLSHILMAQNLLEKITGIKYHIFEYNGSTLVYKEFSDDVKNEFLSKMYNDKTLLSLDIYYDCLGEVCFSPLEQIQK